MNRFKTNLSCIFNLIKLRRKKPIYIKFTKEDLKAAQENGYWFVHDPRTRVLKRIHYTESSAVNEACRLAQQHPGIHFFVLQAVRYCILPKQQVIELEVNYK